MNINDNRKLLYCKINELKKAADELISLVKKMQDDAECVYNTKHEQAFNGFNDEQTEETDFIGDLDCIRSHLKDVLQDIDSAQEFAE